MKAIGAASTGDLTAVEVVELDDPTPGSGQVRVRVHASALNAADVKVLRGELAGRFLHARVSPLVVGYDFSGVIDAIGDGVDDLAVGDAVFGHLAYSGKNRQGTLAELVIAEAGEIAEVPDGVDHATAAVSATVGLTALQALRDGAAVSDGHRVLVLGASGGVGSLAVGIAGRLGATVTGVCSTYAVDFVTELGAAEVIDRQLADPLEHDRPFDAVFDTTGLYAYSDCVPLLTRTGAFVTTLPSPSFVAGKLRALFSRRSCSLVIVRSSRADLEQLGAWLADGLAVPIAERYDARDAGAALARMDEGHLLGKIAIDVVAGL
jgi:NADPH:quinone reductase-like Zn-dependent oxidoreductase